MKLLILFSKGFQKILLIMANFLNSLEFLDPLNFNLKISKKNYKEAKKEFLLFVDNLKGNFFFEIEEYNEVFLIILHSLFF